MIYLTYDGSVNADWVAKYAVSLARDTSNPLTLLHVLNPSTDPERLNSQIASIESLALNHNIIFSSEILPLKKSVLETIISRIGEKTDDLCLCGTRVRQKGQGLLSGTVTEKLLKYAKFPVLALRVVQPGLMGRPENIMIAASGRPDFTRFINPLIALLKDNMKSLHIVRIMKIARFRFSFLSGKASKTLRLKGLNYLKEVVEEIKKSLSEEKDRIHIDTRVEIASDWPEEILIQAGKLKSELILLGATEKTLPSRYFYGNKLERILRDAPCDVGIFKFR